MDSGLPHLENGQSRVVLHLFRFQRAAVASHVPGTATGFVGVDAGCRPSPQPAGQQNVPIPISPHRRRVGLGITHVIVQI